MHSKAAGSAIAGTAVGILSTAGSLAALRFTGAIQPEALDVAVPVGLIVISVLLLRREEWLAASLLAWAATLWSMTSAAGLLGASLEPVLLRLALVPHALVIGAVLSLPYGDLAGRRRVLAVSALVVGLFAGAGVVVAIPTLVLLGIIPIAAALAWAGRSSSPEASATRVAQLTIGAAFVLLGTLTTRLGVRAMADGVDLLLLGSAVAVAAIIGRSEVATDLGFEISRRVGAVLGQPSVDVRFPVADDPAVVLDVDGHQLPTPAGTAVRAGGSVVAWISPPVALGSGAQRMLANQLRPIAAIAALNDEKRRQADLLDDSRRRLAAAADEERLRVTRGLTRTVMHRLNVIEGLLDEASPSYAELQRVRGELTGLVAGMDPLRGRTLGEALLAMRDRVAEVQASAALDAAPGVAQAAWWVAAEAVANALKHAPGAPVVVRARRDEPFLVVEVSDEGPGGADPGGRGLLGIADRAAVAGGRLDVHTGAGGTTVRVVLPTGWPVGTSRFAPDPALPV
jgi:hypothetical protein